MSNKFEPKPAERVGDQTVSIWNELGALAVKNNAVNLGQGFPDGPAPKFITELLKQISKKPEDVKAHQYTRGYGHPQLVDILSKWYSKLYHTKVDAMQDILITVGAYHALYYCFLGWIDSGDEVMIIEPAFDCYAPQIKFAGGIPIPVVMHLPDNATSASEYTIDRDFLEQKVTEKTKMLVINNPNNPTGKLFKWEELKEIAAFAKKHNLIVIADEVYEFHVWENRMIRFASLPGMYERTISIGSAGKVFSVTGWKLGWAIGPQHLLAPLKAIHQNCSFTCSSPTQLAVAKAFEMEFFKYFLKEKDSYLAVKLPRELLEKKKMMEKYLIKGGFVPIMPEAGYFMMASYSGISAEIDTSNLFEYHEPADVVFSKWLCNKKKLAVIPVSVFYCSSEAKKDNEGHIRVCYFKQEKTLKAAKEVLCKLSKK